MQRQVIETVDGVTRVVYVDCGPGRARVGREAPVTRESVSGYVGCDYLFAHPAALVRKQAGDRVSR